MRNLKTFALLLLMAVCSMGAKAATVNDLVAIDYDYVFIADDMETVPLPVERTSTRFV